MEMKVTDQKDRVVRIKQELQSPIRTDKIPFRGDWTPTPVIRLPINLLLYRVENGRIGVMQREHIRRLGLAEDYFMAGEENEEVQAALHKILLGLARDSRADVYGEMKFQRRQTENLLVTHSGVVVNGNRRLASMRDLFEGEENIVSFGNVDVAVLPENATLPDIEEIESQLQEVPETKLEYDWVSRRLKLRRRRDQLQIPAETLVKMYRFSGKKDINREIQQLELAEDYLERYLGAARSYTEVEKSEQMFKQLQAALEKKSGEMEELSRFIAYSLIKESASISDRAYAFRSAFGPDAEEVLERVAAEAGVVVAAPVTTDDGQSDDADPLAGISDEVPRYAALKPFLMDASSSKDRAIQIARITAAIQQEKQDGGRRLVALRKAETANRTLHELELDGADPATFQAIRAQLTTCVERANILIGQLATISSPPIQE